MTTTKVNLANTVEGILPVANGGTGTSTGVAPGGSTTQVQYNNAGAFGGDSGFVYTGGNVGIGTSSPTAKLYVNANNATATQILQDETNGAKLRLLANSINFDIANGGGGGSLSVSGAYPLTFSTNSSERMRILSGGNLMIGLTSGAATLVNINGDISFKGTTNGNYSINNFENGALIFGTNSNTERMRITSGGNVGIGTTNPNTKLVVSDNGAAGFELDATGVDSGPYFQAYNRSTSAFIPLTTQSSYIAFRTGSSPTERFRIGPSGQLGIGGANYGSSGQVLTSQGSGSAPTWGAVSGTVNAWVLWNGSAISSSVNVSSVTNPATGAYTINFTTAFSSGTSFAALALGQGGGGTTDGDCAIDTSSYPRNSGSSITIVRKRTDNNARENGAFNAAFIGT
jgi:uncharacterized protein YaiE (UPF0345 family)